MTDTTTTRRQLPSESEAFQSAMAAGHVGRPSSYSRYVSDIICRRIAEGETLSAICADKDMPARNAVYRWIENNTDGFGSRYAWARKCQTLSWADEMVEIADTADNATHMVAKGRNDTRKWLMSRQAPDLWGERKTVDHTSSDGSHDGDDRQMARAILAILKQGVDLPGLSLGVNPREEQERMADMVESTLEQTHVDGHTTDPSHPRVG